MMRDVNPFDWVIAVLIAAIVVVIGLGIRQDRRMYDDCIADGHKAYECHSVIYGRRR